jgi:hypothetical protein
MENHQSGNKSTPRRVNLAIFGGLEIYKIPVVNCL